MTNRRNAALNAAPWFLPRDGAVTISFAPSGQIVGLSSLAGDAAAHGFLFENGRMIDLGTLVGDFSEALDINERDQIVGQSNSI